MEVTEQAELHASETQMLKTVENVSGLASSPLDNSVLMKTAHGNIRHQSATDGIMIEAKANGKVQGLSSADFMQQSNIHSIQSADSAEVVSKGGVIPDNVRRNQERRDNYL